MRDSEPRLDLDAVRLEMVDRLLQILDPVDEHRLISLQMPRKQNCRLPLSQPNHRHPRPERLNRERRPCPKALGEVGKVGGDVAAWEVDEVELVEHGA